MRLQPIKFHLQFRDHLESKVVPAVGARINHPFVDRLGCGHDAEERVSKPGDPSTLPIFIPSWSADSADEFLE